MKSGFALLSRDSDLIAAALQAAAEVDIELKLLEEYPVLSGANYLIADPKALIEFPSLRPDVLISHDLSESLWRFAATYAPAQLIQLPAAASWFQTWLTSQQVVQSPLISLHAATAAAGCSVLATALSFQAAKNNDVVLIDLDHARSALALLSTIELANAVTWEQLLNLTGLPAGSALFNGLPKLNSFRLLSFAQSTKKPLPTNLIESVIAALREHAKLVILDLGQTDLTELRRTKIDLNIAVAPANLLGIAKAKKSAADLIVLRVEPKSGIAQSAALDYLASENVLTYKSDPKINLDITDGLVPGERNKSQLQRISNQLLARLNVK